MGSRSRTRRRRRTAARVLVVAVTSAVCGSATFVGGLLAAPAEFDRALPPAPKAALLLASDGRTQFATIPPPVKRELVSAQEIPDVLRQAVIAAEDERFLEHRGVDPMAIVRAAYNDLSGGRRQGGSTLTQQYVKNVYVGNEVTYLRKVREAALAVRLEQRKSKEEILTDYLNVLYLGNGTYGVQAASKYYFGVAVKDLDLDEKRKRRDKGLAIARASMLAGIAPAPSAWNPVADFGTARGRQAYTINRMIELGYVSPEEGSAAYARQAAVIPLQETPPEPPTNAPEFADLLRAQLRGQFDGDREDELFRGGVRVRTTLDLDLQTAASTALREVLPDPTDPQAAVVAIDIRKGDVKAMSTLLRKPERRGPDGKVADAAITGYQRNGLNLATSGFRSSGSTIKPFTLAVALRKGRSLDDRVFAPACASMRDPGEPGGVYRYCNAAGESGGSRTHTLRSALYSSVNTVFVPLAKDVGRSDIKDLMLAAGVRPVMSRFHTNVNSFGLGATAEVTPLSMANAFGTLVNHGIKVKPRYFTEVRSGASGADQGEVLEGEAPRTEARPLGKLLPRAVADQVAEAMREVPERGTARAAKQPFPVYGKTGTTNDSKDSWFIGCMREPHWMCVAVWMGYEYKECESVGRDGKLVARVVGDSCGGMKDLHGVKQVYGGTLPAKVFARTFELLRQIKADREAGRAPLATPSSAATSGGTPSTRRPTSPAPRRSTAAPRPTAVRTSASPAPEPTPSAGPTLLPGQDEQPDEPSPSPGGAREAP